MAEYKTGERVRGTGVRSGTRYVGAVIRNEGGLPGAECYIEVITADGKPTIGTRRANIKNVERIEDMSYNKNLIGPKPEPVQTPKFVAPFRSDGRSVVDANGKVVTRVVQGGYRNGGFSQDLPMSEAYDLAGIVAEALTEKFGTKVKDAPSPF